MCTDRAAIRIAWSADGANATTSACSIPPSSQSTPGTRRRHRDPPPRPRHHSAETRALSLPWHRQSGRRQATCQRGGDQGAQAASAAGMRCPVERTNFVALHFGALRRNTAHHLAQLALAVTFLITAKLIDWRNRWCPAPGRPYPLSLLVESYCPSRSTSTGQ